MPTNIGEALTILEGLVARGERKEPPAEKDIFTIKTTPLITIKDYVLRILRYTKFDLRDDNPNNPELEEELLSLVSKTLSILESLSNSHTIVINKLTVHILFATTFLLVLKAEYDFPVSMKFYSDLFGVTKTMLDKLEIELFCKILRQNQTPKILDANYILSGIDDILDNKGSVHTNVEASSNYSLHSNISSSSISTVANSMLYSVQTYKDSSDNQHPCPENEPKGKSPRLSHCMS